MRFLVYSSLDSRSIESSLGVADYSYYFVMQRFLPLLQEFGEVVVLEEPATDELLAGHLEADRCLYLSFTPPGKLAPVSLCPAIPVFAWEFSTIPYEEFTGPEDNWVSALHRAGGAITHSSFAADVVKQQMGPDYDIVSIPAPLWDSCESIRRARRDTPPQGLGGLELNCTEIDSACYEISNTSVRPKTGAQGDHARFRTPAWDGEPMEVSFGGDFSGVTLIGFNQPEPWGVWSRSGHPWIMLDRTVSGTIELAITLRGYAQNVGTPLRLELGSGSAWVLLTEHLETHVLTMQVDQASSFLAFFGLEKRAVDMADPRDIGVGLSLLGIRQLPPQSQSPQPLILDFASDELELQGFHAVEPSGRWTASSQCMVRLPHTVCGNVDVRLELFHMLHNDERTIDFWLGSHCHKLTLSRGLHSYELSLTAVDGTDYLLLGNLGVGDSGNPDDPRSLGLGIAKLSFTPAAARKTPAWLQKPRTRTDRQRSGSAGENILYTAIFNPHDGRKNWEDIVTAFVYAFRENPGVTLLIKITNNDLSMFFEDIFSFFIELHPFECRLVFIHGYLHYEQYEQLLLHSHYIVNASRGEGQCLPLMEFMSSGVPAIAPRNTAMLDYIDHSNAFVVESSGEITFWPQDPRQVFRTYWHRINWQTLHDAFRQSEVIARRRPRKYRQMASSAIASLQDYCSMDTARQRLSGFVRHFADDGDR